MSAAPAPWRTLLDRALRENPLRPDAGYLQLATVRADGRPANRTIFFRGMLDPGDRILFTTNLYSAKVGELTAHPFAAACWHFLVTREQFRLDGRVELVGAAHPDAALRAERARVWKEKREDSRQTFAWPRPGLPREPDAAFAAPPSDPDAPAPNFLLCVLSLEEVDYIDLRPLPHLRWHYRRQGASGWSAEAWNP